jgi:hypothetical protein
MYERQYPQKPQDQCKGVVAGREQCPFARVPGGDFCPIHSPKIRSFDYIVGTARYTEHRTSENIKSLQDEIAIVRAMVQRLLEKDIDNPGILKLVSLLNDLAITCGKVIATLSEYVERQNLIDILNRILPYVKDDEDILEIFEGLIVEHISDDEVYQLKGGLFESRTREKVTNLRTEIALLRTLLERILNRVQTHNDLILNLDQITRYINSIRLLVQSCTKLEANFGLLLDANEAKGIIEKVARLLSDHLDDPNAVAKVIEELKCSSTT